MAACADCSRKTVSKARKAVRRGELPDVTRQRKEGGGRKSFAFLNPAILSAILKYVELRSYGPCTKDVRDYTAATLDSIQEFVQRKYGKTIAHSTISAILVRENIRLRTNKKLLYGNQGKETEAQKALRHLQFDYIYSTLNGNHPDAILVSMDCKKKEPIGRFAITGKSYAQAGHEVPAEEHDFIKPLNVATLKGMDDLLDREEGKAIPYGLYDITMNKGYVNVGISHDTPEFVVESIRRFFPQIREDHPGAKVLYLFCDGGGSNRAGSHVFYYHLMKLSKEIGMKIIVVHYPPYRSKFNYIERKLFCVISKQFERVQLRNLRTVLGLLENTTTKKGLTVKAELDTNVYELGQKITEEQLKKITVEYLGPTKDAKVKLSYAIDGSKFVDIDHLGKDKKTVFDIKENIDKTKEEKEKLKKEAEAKKAARAKATAEKKEAKAKAAAEKEAAKANATNGKKKAAKTSGKKSKPNAKDKDTPI